MNDKIINLRRVKKNLAKAASTLLAENNRVKFGRTKGEKSRVAAEKLLASQKLDGHKRRS